MTMCIQNTPVEDHRETLGCFVKREDLCCPGGPNFSKARGVYAHIAKRPERFIGVLDTSHSQGGWAVARACQLLGKQCVNFYPEFKASQGAIPAAVRESMALGAQLLPLRAGRSAVLYHGARAWLAGHPDQVEGSYYMMPNALKLEESVEETAAEVARTFPRLDNSRLPVLVSASSGTIAAGVLRGLVHAGWRGRLIVHMGYSRSVDAVHTYVTRMARVDGIDLVSQAGIQVVDEGYEYKDAARPGDDPPFPCNAYYDLKAFRWWMREGRARHGPVALLWNIG